MKQDDSEDVNDDLISKLSHLPQTWSWWTLRALTLQQRMLSGMSASIRTLITALISLVITSSLSLDLAILNTLDPGGGKGGGGGDKR